MSEPDSSPAAKPSSAFESSGVEGSEGTPAGGPRFCDIVMKGGITSGIVYPRAVAKLAAEYHFKGIGGASAGAIAAAATAAAEYRRRHEGSLEGFRLLDQLPAVLGRADDSNRSRLFRLFRPEPGTRRLFGVLEAVLDAPKQGRLGALVQSLVFQFRWFVLLGFVAFAALSILCILPLKTPFALLPALLVGLLGAMIALVIGLTTSLRSFADNGFGLCRGFSQDRTRDGETLTLWLARLIERIAGRDPAGPPLTFGELWRAPGFPPEWLELPREHTARSISLQMVTTNATFGRPHVLPFEDRQSRLFFRADELSAYFPKEVVAFLVAHAAPYEPTPSDPAALPDGLYPLPPAEHLPVVVAARLSLSFPALVSAVPLWAIDYEVPRGVREFRRCWFSDGGVSSNFPIHFFDDLLPLWPTFGIKLEPFPRGYDDLDRDRIFMPPGNDKGYGDAWSRFDDEPDPLGKTLGFFGALVNSALDWNDNMLSRLPGYRDRVVRVRLQPDEGGMNLNMDAAKITRLGRAGERAAGALVSRFVTNQVESPPGHAMGWDNHRWLRQRSLLAILEQTLPRLELALARQDPRDPPYRALLQQAARRGPDEFPLSDEVAAPFEQSQVDAADRTMSRLAELAANARAAEPSVPSAPAPLPVLRARPRN